MAQEERLKEIIMAQEEQVKKIIVHLRNPAVQKIVLCGERGSGKTWLARELCNGAMNAKLFSYALWLPLAKENVPHFQLRQIIAGQLGLLSTLSEIEEDVLKREGHEEYNAQWNKVAQKISKKLRKPKHCPNSRCLIVLDGTRDKNHVEDILESIYNMVAEKHQLFLKFLITSEWDPKTSWPDDMEVIFIKRLQPGEALTPIIEKTRYQILGLCPPVAERSAEIRTTTDEGKEICELPSDDVDVKNCQWHFRHLFNKHGSIHYNALIAHWMIEGYLGPIYSIMESYYMGRNLLMRMMEHGIIKHEEFGRLTFAGGDRKIEYRQSGFLGTGNVGLVNVFEDGEPIPLEEIVPVNGMMRTLQLDRAHGSCFSLLLDKNLLNRKVLDCFGETLKCLAYFNPRPIALPYLLSKLKNLSILILRNCDLVDGIFSSITQLQSLIVLEISGTNSVETLPKDSFSNLIKLRSLNMSGLPIKGLPESLSDLVELRWLILRNCSRLSNLPSQKKMTKLEVLDLSGASSLSKKTSQVLKSPLQMLNFSHTPMKSLPHLHYVPEMLTHLVLRGCSNLHTLLSLDKLSRLQVLDVSGAKSLLTISLKNKVDLVTLDLSGTGLKELPTELTGLNKLCDLNLSRTEIKDFSSLSELSSLRKLIIQHCLSLRTLPVINKLTSLEVFDISGCKNLQPLPDLTMQKNLKVLDISGCSSMKIPEEYTLEPCSIPCIDSSGKNICRLPEFSYLTSLSKLFLGGLELTHIDGLHSLSNLEELNLEHARFPELSICALLERLENLQILNLSSTSVKELPLSKLRKLRQLLLANCSSMDTMLHLKELCLLVVLDLSNTKVKSELFVDAPMTLQKLLLKDCPHAEGSFPLKSLTQLEMLDLEGTNVTGFSIEASQMKNMKSLRLSCKTGVEGSYWNMREGISEDLIWDKNNLSKLGEVRIKGCNKPSIFASGDHFFRVLEKKNPICWEALFKQLHISFSPSGEDYMIIHFHGDDLIFKDSQLWYKRFPTAKLQGRSLEIHGFASYPKGIESRLQEAANVALVDSSFIHSYSDLQLRNVKVCFIGHCCNLKCAFNREKKDEGSVKFPESLVLSDLANLESCFAHDVTTESIETLNHIYIDCCPLLQTGFTASKEPINLESLHIKFCEKLKSVCDEEGSSQVTLEKLVLLTLFGLPELESVKANLPALQTLCIGQCSKINNLDELFACSKKLKMLQNLQIKSCDGLVTLFKIGGLSSSLPTVLPNLHTLLLSELPRLKTIKGSFPSLRTITISNCPVLETLDEVLTSLPVLHTIQLSNLPKLCSFEGEFPSLRTVDIKLCPLIPSDQKEKLARSATQAN